MQDKRSHPGMVRLLQAVIMLVLLPTFVLPFVGMAASGAWTAGLTYSLPIMIHVSTGTGTQFWQ
jgi:hypothetical protein